MRFRPGGGIAATLLALAVAWPFWHARTWQHHADVAAERLPEPESLPSADLVQSGALSAVSAPACPGCEDLRRLMRRLRAREEGAARRVDSATKGLAASRADPAVATGRPELALRRAQDDKRGAAAFRAAALEAVRLCESGPGCGETALSDYWVEACPPEHPDLGQEAKALAVLAGVLARKAGACAAAACPEVDCARAERAAALLRAADRTLHALADPGLADMAVPGPNAEKAAQGLLRESEEWRNAIPALFLGGSDPSAQMAAAAEKANGLASALARAREPGGPSRDPLWRLQVLSIRLEATAQALAALAEAGRSNGGGRDALMRAARQQAAEAFRRLLITQMRLRSAAEQAALTVAGAVRRCDGRRRAQIARARGQIRAIGAALSRCARRAACPRWKTAAAAPQTSPGLDPVSALRLALDGSLNELSSAAGALAVRAQKPVILATGLAQYQSGEAVSVTIDSRAAACMADAGSWVGLFPGAAPLLGAAEAEATAPHRLELRGRPWEEVLFEAPSAGGLYEVRTHAAASRGGRTTGRVRFEVTPRAEGCRGFDGTWTTSFGRLRITVRGGEVRGSYKRGDGWRAGFLTGRVKGRILLGEWRSELGSGGTRLVLGEDGRTFSGTWSRFRDAFAGTGIWKGSCEGSVQPQSQSSRSRID